MKTIRIVVKANELTDPGELNNELVAANIVFVGYHNSQEAIVDCDVADEAAVRAIVQAHIDGVAKRRRNKTRKEKIQRLEDKQTLRRMREALAGNTAAITFLQNLDDQIKVERDALES